MTKVPSPARTQTIVEQLLKRCPKSGRIVGFRRDTRLAKLLFPALGILAIAWFLLRVIPKPSRALYPCQRIAAGIGVGFLAYVAGLLVTCAGFRFIRRRLGQAAAVTFICVVGALTYHGIATSQGLQDKQIVQDFTPVEGRNHPMGIGKGIHPGRVVWVQDFKATKWDGVNGRWWQDENTDRPTVDKMFSQTLQGLTEAKSDTAAWDMLFHYFNRVAGRGDRGYQKGEKIAIKLNCNADGKGAPWNRNSGYPDPWVVNLMVRQLIETAGVPGECITLVDSSRAINQIIYDLIRSNSRPDYQQVRFSDSVGGDAPQRMKAEPDMNCPIHFVLPNNPDAVMYLPKTYTEATYLINHMQVRPHSVFGITMSAKNHFGSVFDAQKKVFTPNILHAFAMWQFATPYKHGQYNGLVQLLGHKDLGGKTLLYFADGLYTSRDQGGDVARWSTMGDHWFSSLLMSQDPVAMDSVGYDLICTEPNMTRRNPSFNGQVDGYLHEAALADNPPSKAKYDPENDGTTLKSLGVHEHWNNAQDKKYSRNLGGKEGIELIAISN